MSCEDVEVKLQNTPDWEDTALKGDHLWSPTSISGDFCYVGESHCSKSGNRLKCSACRIIVHQKCVGELIQKLNFQCRSTFEHMPSERFGKKTCVEHHWVRRQTEKNKCHHCSKTFQCKIQFSSREIIAISCSWCKVAYHNKESCFNIRKIKEECSLGSHRSIIVPPNWIIKLTQDNQDKPEKESSTERETFIVRGIPTDEVKPLIVFINPKSGGNQGLRLLQKFQWLLNPRQIFDLTKGGPKRGLLMYQKVHNLRVLACGGDGTVGWILSAIDQLNISPPPAVGVLPLGTGNDLARALGWGGGYADEPLPRLLSSISNSQLIALDRWKIEVEKNSEAQDDGGGNLPLNVINNYYSIGVDAHIALEFHEAREAHPEKFNSRIKNKMFYGQLGGKDLLQRKWKNLADFVTLECDGVDFTPKLKELRVHAIVFLNIASYGGGTHPWNQAMGKTQPSTEDGLIEVVGLTTYQLPLLQAGGHGTCIAQCEKAKIVTSKTIPMQVDGEASKVSPSIINISLLNKATMLANDIGCGKIGKNTPENFEITVNYLIMSNYDEYRSDMSLLMKSASSLGKFEIDWTADLGMLRDEINIFFTRTKDERSSNDWYFIDCSVNGRITKIEREEENLHYVTDIATDDLYIVEFSSETRPLTPKKEGNNDTFDNKKKVKTPASATPKFQENRVVKKSPMKPKKENKPEVHSVTVRPVVIKPVKIESLSKRLFSLSDNPFEKYRYFSVSLYYS
ncbi:hypothetical protein HHI36_016269 [Cryptolaemus montrouzieri]|uniref:Diacylglycerol kinase n=1 Tax=Cryptolaemus montrouzieri TaxID=559131 RepID=A0ABD2NJN1_9CUCU